MTKFWTNGSIVETTVCHNVRLLSTRDVYDIFVEDSTVNDIYIKESELDKICFKRTVLKDGELNDCIFDRLENNTVGYDSLHFKGTIFSKSTFYIVEFIDCVFNHHTVFKNSTFDKVVFRGCSFEDVKFIDCIFKDVEFVKCGFVGTYSWVHPETTTEVEFNGCKFISPSKFDECNFANRLTSIGIKAAGLEESKSTFFNNCSLPKCEFVNCKIDGLSINSGGTISTKYTLPSTNSNVANTRRHSVYRYSTTHTQEGISKAPYRILTDGLL